MVLRTATKDENVPRPRTSVSVGARIRCRPTLAHIGSARIAGCCWVDNKLTETPDTDPCTQAPVSWRNGDFSLM